MDEEQENEYFKTSDILFAAERFNHSGACALVFLWLKPHASFRSYIFGATSFGLVFVWISANAGIPYSLCVSRKYVGGWHASTPLRCLCCSILQVFLCLGVLYPVCMQMPYVTIMGISFLSGMSVIALAPLPPQKMHITTKEFTVLKKLARKVLVVETLLVCVLLPFRLTAFSLLVSLGMGCAAFSLWIAKPKKRRRNKP